MIDYLADHKVPKILRGTLGNLGEALLKFALDINWWAA